MISFPYFASSWRDFDRILLSSNSGMGVEFNWCFRLDSWSDPSLIDWSGVFIDPLIWCNFLL